MSIVKLARPEIQAMRAYENESPRISPIGNFRRPLNRYPEVRPQKLQESLAARFGCATDQLLVTRGSSEAIDLLIRTFCEAGRDSIVTPTPSFSMYWHYARIQGAAVIEVPTFAENDFIIDIDAVLAACNENSKLVFVCSPNNPTGTPLPRADVVKLLEGRAQGSAVVVDEAYVEFGGQESVIDLIKDYPNLLVLRTLSKALGFAGARCGAVAGAVDVIDTAVEEIISERQRLMTAVAAFDFVQEVWPSEANFFLLRVANADEVMQRCAENNVLLRHFGGNLSDCIRITVGSPSDNDQLLRVLGTLTESRDG